MKITRILFTLFLFICTVAKTNAQSIPDTTTSKPVSAGVKMNLIKVNLTAIPLKNYSLQYERVINRKLSFALAVRVMPNTGIPFKKQILETVGENDPDTRDVIEKFKLSNFAITPELRLYLSKRGFGRGFYVAPFYRYASFKTNNLVFDYETAPGIESNITLAGKLSSHTGGLLFGAQWPLGKSVCLDWWIFGPHYGSATGNFSGVSSKPLTTTEQADLRQELEDLDIPFTTKTVTVNANGATLKLDGPWAGLRAGISIGIRF